MVSRRNKKTARGGKSKKAMKNFALLVLLCFFSCNKVEKMKNKIVPERPYEKAQIDNFYWVDSGWDYTLIPLVKPFQLIKL